MDLNRLLVERPGSTFFFRAGASLLVVDRVAELRFGDRVLVLAGGDFLVKLVGLSCLEGEVWGRIMAVVQMF